MINVKQARELTLKNIRFLEKFEILALLSCLERVSAVDIMSKEDTPPFNNSAMDGFAIRAGDSSGVSKQSPKIFEVIEDLPAGYKAKKRIGSCQAIRIMTGAPMPSGADAVIMVEDTEQGIGNRGQGIGKGKEFVRIFREIKPGENVRYAGEDIRKNEMVIKRGTLLKPGHIGVLASLGISRLKVFCRPRVAILSTGDELVEINQRLRSGKIRNSNSYSLSAQVLKIGGLPILLGISKDIKKALKQKIREGLNKADMLLISGGISVGKYDLVKDVLVDLGAEIKFWKVAMRPGKPFVFGVIKDKVIFGLPGNPVSSMVSFEVFVRPAILKMMGRINQEAGEVEAVAEEDIIKKKGLRYFLRAKTRWENGSYITRTTGPQGSGILRSLALANSLIILREEKEYIKKGQKVTVRFII